MAVATRQIIREQPPTRARPIRLRWEGPPAAPVRERREAAKRSFATLSKLWTGSWDAALSAVETAGRAHTLSTNEAATHRAVIFSEREVVTTELRLLGAHDL